MTALQLRLVEPAVGRFRSHWPAVSRWRCSAYQVACEWLLLRSRTSTPTDFRTSQTGMSSRTTELR